ncbi:MAG TPA: DUF883 family protein [Steroidobacteraceae bacterium]|nr:DUF883 family protein [Steroidobacteraceae bacterium]
MAASSSAAAASVSKDKLYRDMQAVVDDAEALLSATASQAGEKVQEVRARTKESLTAARARLSSIEKSAIHRARAAVDGSNEYVHENPWIAIGVAAGAGFLAGLLLTRR